MRTFTYPSRYTLGQMPALIKNPLSRPERHNLRWQLARARSASIKGIVSFFAPVVALPLLAALAAQSEARAAEEQPSPSYRVEVGAFRIESHARALCDPLVQQGHPVAVGVVVESTGSTPLFVCRSARTYDRAGAQAIAEGIHKEGRYQPIVVAVSSASRSQRLSKSAERSAVLTIAPELRQDFERFMEEQDPSRAAKPVERSDPPGIAPELRSEFERFMEEQEKGTSLAPAPPQVAGSLPPCHEVTSAGVSIDRGRACSPVPQ